MPVSFASFNPLRVRRDERLTNCVGTVCVTSMVALGCELSSSSYLLFIILIQMMENPRELGPSTEHVSTSRLATSYGLQVSSVGGCLVYLYSHS